jgi:hypothetical protein
MGIKQVGNIVYVGKITELPDDGVNNGFFISENSDDLFCYFGDSTPKQVNLFIIGNGGNESIRINNSTTTDATADYAFAIGDSTLANGKSSLSSGKLTIANGDYSFVHGLNSVASGNTTIVLGSNITGLKQHTTYVSNLNINTTPLINNSLTKVLSRESNGDISEIDLSTLSSTGLTGSTDLTYTASPTDGLLESSSGSGTTIPLATTTNSGLLSPSEKEEIAKINDININLTNRLTVKLSENINKGQAVYVTGANGTNILAGKASNTSETTSSKTLGLIEKTGSVNDKVDVVTNGLFSGLNTSSGVVGGSVWLGVNGNLVYGAEPLSPLHSVYIGVVTRVSSTVGEIFVKVQNGYQMAQIHDYLDVNYNMIKDGDKLMVKDVANSLWKNFTFGFLKSEIATQLTAVNYETSGKVNVLAGSTSLVVTNNSVTENSIVICQLGTNDATCRINSVVEETGSFTINYVAPTETTTIKFLVIN